MCCIRSKVQAAYTLCVAKVWRAIGSIYLAILSSLSIALDDILQEVLGDVGQPSRQERRLVRIELIILKYAQKGSSVNNTLILPVH